MSSSEKTEKSQTKTTETGQTKTDESQASGADDEKRSPEEIQADIDSTREELGETVTAVAEKADVKKQAKAKLDDAKQSLGAKKDSFAEKASEASPDSASAGVERAQQLAKENPVPLGLAGAFVAGFLAAKLFSR